MIEREPLVFVNGFSDAATDGVVPHVWCFPAGIFHQEGQEALITCFGRLGAELKELVPAGLRTNMARGHHGLEECGSADFLLKLFPPVLPPQASEMLSVMSSTGVPSSLLQACITFLVKAMRSPSK